MEVAVAYYLVVLAAVVGVLAWHQLSEQTRRLKPLRVRRSSR
jgi:hypothetical protein